MNAAVMVPTTNYVNPPGNMNPVSAVPSQRIMQAFGSETNADCFFLLNSRINNMKSRVSYPEVAYSFALEETTANVIGTGLALAST
jgi:hypothetical protein